MGRYAPALVAAGILGIVGIAAAYGGGDRESDSSAPAVVEFAEPLEETWATDPYLTEPVVSAPDVEVETSATVKPKDQIKRTLGKGARGKDVQRVQRRLIELGFDPG
ncbi:MAG: hypothetical protein NZL87_09810, partial [Thermomicrobium sp.]|nr:hypothetical protein [Thermomicrobium sp.]